MKINKQRILIYAVALTLGSGLVLTSVELFPDRGVRLYLNILAVYIAGAALVSWAIYVGRRDAGSSIELVWSAFRRPVAMVGAFLASVFVSSSVAYIATSHMVDYPALVPLAFSVAGVVGGSFLVPAAVAFVRSAR